MQLWAKIGISCCILFELVACSSPRKRAIPRDNSAETPVSTAKSAKALPAPFNLPNNPSPLDPQAAIADAEEADSETADLDEQKPLQTAGEAADEPDDELEPAPSTTPEKHHVPFEFNQKVAEWIQYFSQKDRERFQRYLDRGEPYREVIENILEENNVPADIYYLGLIESGFDFRAKSRVAAVGVWQFMRSTGKLYGLKSDAYIDERRDPIRATEAAAKMLRDLYHEFHSWYLAMAAYNAGLGRIRGAIRRAGGTHDFWELVEKKKLPRETMEYVPKFLAARYIGQHPDLFAFYLNEEKKYPDVHLVDVPSPVTFNQIEKDCSIPDNTLSFVNPHYLKSYTHPAKKIDQIWVPDQYLASVQKNYRQLESQRIHVKLERLVLHEPQSRKGLTYVVRSGDTLRSIAKKRGLSIAYLKQVNGLRSSRVAVGQRLQLSATSYRQRKSHPRKRNRHHRK